MSRLLGLGLGTAAACAGWLATAVPPAKAGEAIKWVEMLRGHGAHLGTVLRDVESGDVSRLKLSDERGVVVREVQPDTPAEKAGIKAGDVILRYQGESVWSVAQFVRLVRETPAGRKVSLEVSRDGAMQKLTATLDERRGDVLFSDLADEAPLPPIPPEVTMPLLDKQPWGRRLRLHDFGLDRGPRKLGIEYQEISGQLARYFKLPDDGGVLVSSVEENGPAGKAGVKAGDVILKINGKSVRDGDDLRHELSRLDPGDEATLTLQRDGASREIKLKLGGRTDEPRSGEST